MFQADLSTMQDAARPLRARITELERLMDAEEETAAPDGDKITSWDNELEALAPKLERLEEDISDLRTYMAEERGCHCGSTSGSCSC